MSLGEISNHHASRHAIRILEGTFIPHGQQRDLFEQIDSLRRRCPTHGVPSEDDAEDIGSRLLLISGESGAGKSRLLKEYLAREKRRGTFRSTADGDVRPVIYVENAAKGTREFAVLVLKALGYPTPPRDWTASDISTHISHLCREMRTEVLLVDEAQFIVMGKTADNIQTMRDFVKRLLNDCPAQLVLAGVPNLLAFLDQEGENALDHNQIFRRRAPVVELVPYDWSVPTEQVRFTKLLEEMQKLTGLQFVQPLNGEFLARRIYLASGGEIGMVAKYLGALVSRPSRKVMPPVSPDDLADIWWSFHRPLGQRTRPMAFDDVRVPDAKANQSANPFLADDAQLRVLWKNWAMAGLPATSQASDERGISDEDAGDDKPCVTDRQPGDGGTPGSHGATRKKQSGSRSQKKLGKSDF